MPATSSFRCMRKDYTIYSKCASYLCAIPYLGRAISWRYAPWRNGLCSTGRRKKYVRQVGNLRYPNEDARSSAGVDHHPGTNCHACVCSFKTELEANNDSPNNRNPHSAPGCDFPGKCFFRSLLWNVSRRDESCRRAQVHGCAQDTDGEWSQRRLTEQ